MEKNTVFVDGAIFKRPESAPDYVIGNMSIKVTEFIEFLRTHEKDGWVNIKTKRSKAGKYYMELSDWKPGKDKAPEKPLPQQQQVSLDIPDYDPENDDLPF